MAKWTPLGDFLQQREWEAAYRLKKASPLNKAPPSNQPIRFRIWRWVAAVYTIYSEPESDATSESSSSFGNIHQPTLT